MKKIIFNIIFDIILFSVFLYCSWGIFGGISYLLFPREDRVGDASILDSCRDLGGKPQWAFAPGMCSEGECSIEVCAMSGGTYIGIDTL